MHFFILVSTFILSTTSQATEFRGYIVKLKSQNALTALSTSPASLGVKINSSIPELRLIVTDKNPLTNPTAMAREIEYVEPNYLVHVVQNIPSQSSSISDNLWGMKEIQAEKAWTISQGDKSVIAAISDTGVYIHENLKDNFWRNPGETGTDANGKDKSKNSIDDDKNGFVDDLIGWNFETDSATPMDDHFHGTHVSGTIGATGRDDVAGVNWHVSLMEVKFLGGRDGFGTTENGIKTILYAANNGAKVINCSWGSDEYEQSLKDAVDYAKSKGVIIVAAAGNDGADADQLPLYPAAYNSDNIISVAATSSVDHGRADFSNWGEKTVHLAAPGQEILSTFNPMYNSLYYPCSFYCKISGTSMAAPHVTGTVALMYAANPKLSYTQVKSILVSTVTKSSIWDKKTISGGVLNTYEAVKAAVATK